MNSMRIALAQFVSVSGGKEENCEAICSLMQRAAKEGADLVLFPECSLTGYAPQSAQSYAIVSVISPENAPQTFAGSTPDEPTSAPDPALCKIRALAEELSISVCFGYMERNGERFYISQELAGPGEHFLYRKTHLGSKEKAFLSEGDHFPVFHGSLCTGIQICFESHIPEISAAMRKQGAELLLFPYASGMSGEKCLENWSVHLPARASDNGVFAAACNLVWEQEGRLLGGGMCIYDPKGRQIASFSGQEEHLLIADLEGPLPREYPEGDMRHISYFDRRREELF